MSFEKRVQNLVIRLHEIGGLKFGDFQMKVGVNSPVYFDLRVIFSYPDLMVRYIKYLLFDSTNFIMLSFLSLMLILLINCYLFIILA